MKCLRHYQCDTISTHIAWDVRLEKWRWSVLTRNWEFWAAILHYGNKRGLGIHSRGQHRPQKAVCSTEWREEKVPWKQERATSSSCYPGKQDAKLCTLTDSGESFILSIWTLIFIKVTVFCLDSDCFSLKWWNHSGISQQFCVTFVHQESHVLLHTPCFVVIVCRFIIPLNR